MKSTQCKAKTAFWEQPRVKRWTICPGQRVLIFCREHSLQTAHAVTFPPKGERGCQKIGTFGESADRGNQDILSFIRETEKILKLVWLLIATYFLCAIFANEISTSPVPQCSVHLNQDSGCYLCPTWPGSSCKRVPLDKCWSDIGAAGMWSKYRHPVQICPKYSQFWNFAYYHSPGQDGIGVGRSRNNELPMELICPQWLQSETLGKGGTRRKYVLEKFCDFREVQTGSYICVANKMVTSELICELLFSYASSSTPQSVSSSFPNSSARHDDLCQLGPVWSLSNLG